MVVCPICEAIYGFTEIETNDGKYYFCSFCEHQWKAGTEFEDERILDGDQGNDDGTIPD